VSDAAGPDAADEGAALRSLEERLGHRFADRGLLETALCHASRAHEAGEGRGNERLEFLGDAVLDLVTSELLYAAHPDWDEGTLTRTRAGLVNRSALADCARRLGLGPLIRLGRTEQRSGGGDKATILADAFEAVLGALYLDAGLAPVEALVRRVFGDAIARDAERDPKTEFQEWAHARFRATPRYHSADDTGTEDDEQRFTAEVRVGDEAWGRGRGRSKRAAERAAASAALARVRALGDG
jgi:ribonuclease-3